MASVSIWLENDVSCMFKLLWDVDAFMEGAVAKRDNGRRGDDIGSWKQFIFLVFLFKNVCWFELGFILWRIWSLSEITVVVGIILDHGTDLFFIFCL